MCKRTTVAGILKCIMLIASVIIWFILMLSPAECGLSPVLSIVFVLFQICWVAYKFAFDKENTERPKKYPVGKAIVFCVMIITLIVRYVFFP